MKRTEMVRVLRRAVVTLNRQFGTECAGPPVLHEMRDEIEGVANALDVGGMEFDRLTGHTPKPAPIGVMRDGAANWLRQFAADCRAGTRLHRHAGDDADCLEALASRMESRHV